MSVNPPSAAIHSINHDILLYIFTNNADMFSDGQALHITLIASQVCHQWRSLMLDTPSMWAKLIDMDTIYDSDQELGDELIRRSGTAPLWIKSSGIFENQFVANDDRDEAFEEFFISVISGNWDRIQKLVIHGACSSCGLVRSMLCFPAPQLEELEASLPEETENSGNLNEETSTVPLFSDQAPMLRRFFLKNYVVDQQAPWLGHLRFIGLDRTYDLPDALTVLSATHKLEELRIDDLADEDISTSLPVVSLPLLKHLQYNGHPYPISRLLDHIEISTACSLAVRISYTSDRERMTEIRQQLLSAVNVFIRYAKRYLQSYMFDIVCLDYFAHNSITFSGKTTFPVESQLEISIPQHDDYDSSQLVMLFNQLARLDLSGITKLQLRAKGHMNPYWVPFFSCFSSLNIICVDSKTLGFLIDLQAWIIATSVKRPDVIFPLIKCVEFAITDFYDAGMSTADQVIVALSYVMPRLRYGRPISTLDMSKYLPLDDPSNLDAFTEVKGLKDLKLLYKYSGIEGKFEYSCGSGNQEKRIEI
ncbi:hypothetical protein HYPSUDRAFT_36433 [Hypholoma sublateritium FD-334 SS-4]|uniref:Uncharacterized protein n=1 Tax=Hypholoma sublateritium (strain FD-334 SS-4) TaxID=945553 RepID=A0A0D2PDV2_HYPSF|nr:hypothetical protein HYPSUDRAFT_36433 [Hypholoma sublateritium FD-334 SS-4]